MCKAFLYVDSDLKAGAKVKSDLSKIFKAHDFP